MAAIAAYGSARAAARARTAMADEIRAGLLKDPPEIPSKYFYDDAGSRLFEEITRLPEYYQTRTEEGILRAAADPVVARFRPARPAHTGRGAAW